MARTIKNAKAIESKSRTHEITEVYPERLYTVKSSRAGDVYDIELSADGGARCSCPWGKYRPANDKRSSCSHVVAVKNYIEESKGRKLYAYASAETAERQRRPLVESADGVWMVSRKVEAR